jgi:hypothetical protein
MPLSQGFLSIYASLCEELLVPWPASKKKRNDLRMHLFSTRQKYEYQQAYQAPTGAIRVRILEPRRRFRAGV